MPKRGIKVVSFGADGDTRELRAMRISTFSLGCDPLAKFSPSLSLPSLDIPSYWKSTCFAIQKPTEIVYIQDVVHIGVKLKARLLKPSIKLPMGQFLASSGHLHMVRDALSKDVHGIRAIDLSHKDKQNYEAVLRITSNSTLASLAKLYDAYGTFIYLTILRCTIDSYFDKKIELIVRIEKAWTPVFFYRYWRAWILKSTSHSLKHNFLTSNSCMCCELNAHSLIIFAVIMCNHPSFIPWLLGSQCCEKIFRSARSLNTVYSTMINFGMLGLLHRSHCLQMQILLECDADENGILYPHSLVNKIKEGHSEMKCLNNASVVTNKDIENAVL